MSDSKEVQQSYSCTNFNEIYFEHEWTIDNFTNLISLKRSYFKLAQFPVETSNCNDKIAFSIELCPYDASGYLIIALCLESGMGEIYTEFSFCLINRLGVSAPYSKDYTKVFSLDHQRKSEIIHLIDRNNLMNVANNYLDGDKLIIKIKGMIIKTINHPNQIADKSKTSELANDFKLLFLNKELYDITLSASGTEIKAHKAILAARSPVFKAMFTHETTESRQNHVEISDIEHNVLQNMLHFIYTGQILSVETMETGELLVAADKYALMELKSLCVKVLRGNISIENAVDIIMLGDVYGTPDLKEYAKSFITRNLTKVMDTDSWQIMEKNRPNLVTEICRAIATS